MSTAEAMARLDDLSKLAKTLNEQSDQINTILSDFERKLDKMNLGVEVWMNPGTLAKDGCMCADFARLTLAENPRGEKTEYEVLGYGRVLSTGPGPSDKTERSPRFGLLVRTEHWRGVQDDSEDIFDVVWVGSPRRLLQASRELRIKALEVLDRLLEELEKEAKRLLSSIEKGHKTVDNL